MRVNINVGNREVPLETRGSFFRFYNRKFGQNPLKAIMSIAGDLSKYDLEKESDQLEMAKNLDTDVIENLFYAMSAQADKEIETKYKYVESYLDSFEEFKVIDVLFEMMPIIMNSLGASEEPKKK